MSLTAGSSVGRYQIQNLLGSGGMGEVYRAVDPTLGRPVALKVLRAELSGDPERMSRFVHEARAASALNHPNILTIHEVGDHAGSRFLVSELVEGETLRERVARGPLTLREILDITIQTASALSAAHAASIVHRDIKPDNLMLRPDGYVKVLDFGVATFARRRATSADPEATIAPSIETSAGTIVGTIAYMSPEQARGLPVDGRSDCYSLGVVLYELVTGRAPFTAPTTTDLLVAILEREAPPLRSVARGLPLQLEWIIEKALEKDPNLRYQTIADLRVDLQRLKTALESGRLMTAASDAGPDANVVIERELTDDSIEVAAMSGVSRVTLGIGAAAAILIGVAMAYYHLARPGADLPLLVPKGAVLTKARDTVESFGYSGLGSRTSVTFIDGVNIERITAMAGLAAARDAIREGTPVAYWRAGITHTANPSGGLETAPGDYSVRLGPKGELIAFATGYATDSNITHADRAKATSIGLEAIKKAFGIDASGYELEIIERSFPAAKTEMAWRSPATKYGHVEQLQVSLQGEKLILISRSLERPRGYKAPDTPMLMRIFKGAGPVILAAVAAIGWGFGLYYLFKMRNWDALTRPLPLALCAVVVLQVGLSMIGSSGVFQSLLGVIAVAVLLIGTVLPALSGVLSWIRRQSPERMWAAEQLTRGRVFVQTVSASLIDGVSGGAAMAAVVVFADWAALQIAGFEPSISRELNVVDASFGSMIGETLSGSAFIVLGVAFVVEVFDRFRVNAIVSAIVVAVAAGMVAGTDQEAILPALVLVAGLALATAIVVVLYRRRGFLASWIAGMVSGWLTTAMALRSLEDQDLARAANVLAAMVVGIAAAGVWGAGRKLLQKTPTLHPGSELGVDRG
jgi:Protein kinase domain